MRMIILIVVIILIGCIDNERKSESIITDTLNNTPDTNQVTNKINAQINNPVKWNFSAVKIAGNTYEIHLSAGIDDNWHVYSQDAGDVPAATTISFMNHPLISFDGKVKEAGKLENVFDKKLNIRLKYYAKKVDFIQKIKLKSPVKTVVKGTISFVVCNDRTCLPPKDVPFEITVSGK